MVITFTFGQFLGLIFAIVVTALITWGVCKEIYGDNKNG